MFSVGKQVKQGKAFEYACLLSFYKYLKKDQDIVINDNITYQLAKDFYDSLSYVEKEKLNLGARAAIKGIIRLEPQLDNPMTNSPLILSLQEDAKGIHGDVRDVLCIRQQNKWEIGISCKHNHSAVKHSRLSQSIDFGKMWFGIPCSISYFSDINQMFNELREMKERKILWRNIEDKEEKYYVPLLKAFLKELKYIDKENPGVIPKRLLSYLLGKNDFYKVISVNNKKLTKIQAFSLYGTLNRGAGKVNPQVKLPRLNLPTKFYDISFKPNSKSTIIVVADGGWTISMRIHNAKKEVEPSLKFDVQLIGIPPSLYTHFEPWEH